MFIIQPSCLLFFHFIMFLSLLKVFQQKYVHCWTTACSSVTHPAISLGFHQVFRCRVFSISCHDIIHPLRSHIILHTIVSLAFFSLILIYFTQLTAVPSLSSTRKLVKPNQFHCTPSTSTDCLQTHISFFHHLGSVIISTKNHEPRGHHYTHKQNPPSTYKHVIIRVIVSIHITIMIEHSYQNSTNGECTIENITERKYSASPASR